MIDRTLHAALVAGLVVVALFAATSAEGAGGFVSGRPTYRQDVRSVLREGLVQKLRCAEDCLVSGDLLISGERIDALDRRARRPRKLRAASLTGLRLVGRRWYLVRTPLSRRAARRLKRLDGRVRVSAANLAVSLESSRHGSDGWSHSFRP